ncbi:heterokaryon incompatibility, partial [Pyrenochaeta sp. MPI-SDFR-AT-0127]
MRLLFYEAISYTWGSGDTTEEILVDGCTKKVTKSLYEILTGYSSLFLPKLLWIDALCIDQKNDVEKSQQVPLMNKIYRNAILTTVILG